MGRPQKLHCVQVGQLSTGRVGQFCIGTDNEKQVQEQSFETTFRQMRDEQRELE
jgi:hypothetical protein